MSSIIRKHCFQCIEERAPSSYLVIGWWEPADFGGFRKLPFHWFTKKGANMHKEHFRRRFCWLADAGWRWQRRKTYRDRSRVYNTLTPLALNVLNEGSLQAIVCSLLRLSWVQKTSQEAKDFRRKFGKQKIQVRLGRNFSSTSDIVGKEWIFTLWDKTKILLYRAYLISNQTKE